MPKITDAQQRFNNLVTELRHKAWNEPGRAGQEFHVPNGVAAALLTGRGEMMKMIPATDLKAEEVGALYNVIGALINANYALKEHAEYLGNMVHEFDGMVRGLSTHAKKMENFANFRPLNEDTDEDD